jgi:tetrahydromethanopterin S-methyltransferase subunit G
MERSDFYMAEQQINVADKETLDIINNKLDTVDTVVDNIYSKVDTEIGTLTTNLTTVDTVVDGIKTATDRLTSTRAGYIDRIANSTYGLDKIKSTLDTVNTKIDGLNSNGVHGS